VLFTHVFYKLITIINLISVKWNQIHILISPLELPGRVKGYFEVNFFCLWDKNLHSLIALKNSWIRGYILLTLEQTQNWPKYFQITKYQIMRFVRWLLWARVPAKLSPDLSGEWERKSNPVYLKYPWIANMAR